jgi:hypothetical protein
MRSLAAALAALVVVGATSYFAFLPRWSGTWEFWALAAGPSILLAVLAILWARYEGIAREWLLWKPGDFTIGFLGAAALFGVAWAVVRLVAPVGSAREIWLVSLYAQIGDPRDLQAHVALVAPAICAAAFAEEVVWRGAVTRLLAQRVGSRSAWVWAAALYGLAYVPTAWSLHAAGAAGSGLDPVLPFAALGAGLLWGGVVRATGRIVPAIVAHALFDWAVVMMFPLWGARG